MRESESLCSNTLLLMLLLLGGLLPAVPAVRLLLLLLMELCKVGMCQRLLRRYARVGVVAQEFEEYVESGFVERRKEFGQIASFVDGEVRLVLRQLRLSGPNSFLRSTKP